MPIYTIDVACRSTTHDYSALFGTLRAADAQPFMDCRWLADVREDLATVTAKLLKQCAPGDALFVTELAVETRWTATGVGDEAKAWLLSRMTSEPEGNTEANKGLEQ